MLKKVIMPAPIHSFGTKLILKMVTSEMKAYTSSMYAIKLTVAELSF